MQLPEKLEVVHTIETVDAVGIEHRWHEHFRGRRRNGEWFALTKADIAAFKRRRLFTQQRPFDGCPRLSVGWDAEPARDMDAEMDENTSTSAK